MNNLNFNLQLIINGIVSSFFININNSFFSILVFV